MKKIILFIFILPLIVKNNTHAQYWTPLGTGVGTTTYYGEGWVNSIAFYDGDVYAGGVFDSAGGIPVNRIAKWNGTNWSDVGGGIIFNGGPNGHVRTMIVYNGELYAGGVFDSVGGISAKNIAKWNGTSWSSIGTGANSVIIDFAVLNGELYAGGAFDTIGGIAANRIAKWDGATWSSLGAGIDLDRYVDHSTSVWALAVNDGKLYVGGAFDTAGTVSANNIAKWDGANWSALSSGLSNGIVRSLVSYNGELHAGGEFWMTANGYVNHIAKWDGSEWSPVGSGTDFAPASLAVYHGILYAGGFYPSYSDGTGDGVGETYPTTYITKWNGTYWSNVGQGVNGSVSDLLATDSALYVGGGFTYAGNFLANRIAKWLGNCSNPSRPDTIYGNRSICAGSTQSYFLTEVPGATYYTWVLPPDWPGYSTTDSITTIAYYDGEHTISVMANNGCGNSPPQTLAITTVFFPSPDNIYGNISPCPGSTQTYYVNPVQGATSYSWNLPAGWSGNSTTDSITVTVGSDPGIISVTANGSCGSSYAQTLDISINSTPSQPGLIIGSDSVCQSTSQLYSVNPVNGATSYTWSLPTGWSGLSNSNSITVQTGSNIGSISVVANNDCGVSIPQALIVTTKSVPAIPGLINGNDTVCEGSSQTYFIDSVPGAAGYTWDLTFGTAFGFDSTSITITPQYSGYPQDFITVAAYNNCGSSDMFTMPVKVNLLPQQPYSIIGKTGICQGSTHVYSISPVSGATSYTWTLPTGWTGQSIDVSIGVTSGNTTGLISVNANNGCGSGPATSLPVQFVTILSKPGDIIGNTYVTVGELNLYAVKPMSGASGYNWSLSGGGTINSGQNPYELYINWETPGTYDLSVSAVNDCGAGIEQTISINVAPGKTGDPYNLQLYPNPSSGQFYLKAKRVQDKVINVEVLNISGQIVFRSTMRLGANDYTQLIDLDKMAPGIYAVKLVIDDKVYTKSVSIVH
ncbi:MAG TPA: T9SS type A sorting domain-containing protein [Chitinophagaceae bacterium]